jgi:hypothetical protein
MSQRVAPGVVADVEGLTPDWLAAALVRPVTGVRSEPVGTGQIGTCHRLHLDVADSDTHTDTQAPRTLLAKLPATDPATREMLATTYRMEWRFYTAIAPTVAIRTPSVPYAAMADSGGDFVLLLEDLAPAEQGDQLAGCAVEQAHDAVRNLAGLHGPRWCDPTLLDIDGLSINQPEDAALMAELYGPATETLIDILGARLDPADAATLREVVPLIEQWALARADTFGLVHGDYRLDNLLFPPGGAAGVVAIDWQTLSLAHPLRDLAYFTGTSLLPRQRRDHERALVAAYHDALVGHGVVGYSPAQCWDDYRFAMLQGPLVSVFGLAYGARTDRGDAMFAAMVARSCAAIRDLDTLDCI